MKNNQKSYELNQVSVRLVEEPPLISKEPMNSPEAAIRVMSNWLAEMDRELCCVINLQADYRPISMNVVSMGALDSSIVHPREIMKSAILSNAAALMVIHNHPSGNLKPSKEDIMITDRLGKVAALLGIPLADHIITGRNQEFYSLREQEEYKVPRLTFTQNEKELEWTKLIVRDVAGDPYNYGNSRKEKLDAIMSSLEVGVDQILSSDHYKKYLQFLGSFHSYSLNNTILIYHQRPDASLVCGYRKWQAMGRQVRKGEKGIQILAPISVKKVAEQEMRNPETKELILDEQGNAKKEQVERTIQSFKVTTVFDVSQTDGEELPMIRPKELIADAEHYKEFMRSIEKLSPVPIRFDEIQGETKGYYHVENREIVIRKDMSQSQTMKTAVHECVHAYLHNKEIMQVQGNKKDRQTKEVEAESVAYAVCNYFGLDTSDYSFPYIATWGSGREMKELKSSMDLIRKTTGMFVDGMNQELEKTLQEQEESKISFYVAECIEFPVMGEFHEGLTLLQAFEIYDQIPEQRINGIKGIGFDLKDGSDYEGMFELVVGKSLQKDIINSIPGFRENSLVQKAIADVEKVLKQREMKQMQEKQKQQRKREEICL